MTQKLAFYAGKAGSAQFPTMIYQRPTGTAYYGDDYDHDEKCNQFSSHLFLSMDPLSSTYRTGIPGSPVPLLPDGELMNKSVGPGKDVAMLQQATDFS